LAPFSGPKIAELIAIVDHAFEKHPVSKRELKRRQREHDCIVNIQKHLRTAFPKGYMISQDMLTILIATCCQKFILFPTQDEINGR
jgi:hypothetical protein